MCLWHAAWKVLDSVLGAPLRTGRHWGTTRSFGATRGSGMKKPGHAIFRKNRPRTSGVYHVTIHSKQQILVSHDSVG